MTSENFIEVEHVRTWHLSSSQAKFQQFWFECFFQILFSFNSCCLWRLCSLDSFNWLPCFPLGFSKRQYFSFCSFFHIQSSNCFLDQTLFSVGPSFSVLFVCNDASLIFRPHVLTLPGSLTSSWPAKTAKKLNKSGVDFLVLVLPSSNSLIWMPFSSIV